MNHLTSFIKMIDEAGVRYTRADKQGCKLSDDTVITATSIRIEANHGGSPGDVIQGYMGFETTFWFDEATGLLKEIGIHE